MKRFSNEEKRNLLEKVAYFAADIKKAAVTASILCAISVTVFLIAAGFVNASEDYPAAKTVVTVSLTAAVLLALFAVFLTSTEEKLKSLFFRELKELKEMEVFESEE
jgi:multisubunit Na+/H+ antiporter MnhB subunit